MKLLIIGAKGFIGSSIYQYFSPDHEVYGADVFGISGRDFFVLEPINTDFNSIFEHNEFDLCINASGNGSVPISLNKPLLDFELNVNNSVKILDAIRVFNPECKFINLSSAAVYGNPKVLPIVESGDLKPLSPYGWHKLYSENICKEYYYLYNINTINLRLFSVYGENLKKQLFWDLYQKCLRSKHIELFGSGNETRDFIHISDLLTAIECVIKNGLFNGESVNIASGVETNIKKAATIFTQAFDPSIDLSFNNIVKPGDPLNWRADISVLNSFGFKQKMPINEGLKQLVKWLKEST